MAYVRGDKAQFDAWEELANPGWNWNKLWPYFKKVEKMFSPSPWQVELGASIRPENHGFGGELHVGHAITPQNISFYSALQQSWAELGQPSNEDVNGGSTRGYDICPQTLDPKLNERWDSASAFLWPVAHRPNLHLINGTATRVVWADSDSRMRDKGDAEASGAEYVTPDDEVRTALASREMILSAGTFRTPLILERSGVGNPRLLEKIGIEPVVDLPGVGENLVDQSNVPIVFKTKTSLHRGSPYVSFATVADLFGADTSQIAAESRRSLGRWARQVAKSNAGLPNATAIERIFQIQHDLIFDRGVTLAEIFTTTYLGIVVSTAAQLLPFSRGSIHLNDNSTVQENPAIDPKYLSVGFDMVSQIAAGRLASRLASTPPLSHLAVGDLLPPDDKDGSLPPPRINATDRQWRKWTADAISSNWHSMGTAAMMARELGGVVSPRLAVYGTRRLRVVDASIMPTQLSGHPTATLYAIADRAADMIKSDASSISGAENGTD